MLVNKNILAIAAVVVIAALAAYSAILRSAVRRVTDRADENLRRAEACEDALAIARRAHTAAIEAQGYADTQRREIEATRADMAQRVGAIVDSGHLDERVCELARAAYHSAMCTASGGNAMHAAPGTSAP